MKKCAIRRIAALLLAVTLLLVSACSAEIDKLLISQMEQHGNDVLLYVNALQGSGLPAEDIIRAEQMRITTKQGIVAQVRNLSLFRDTGEGVLYTFCVDVSGSLTKKESEKIRNSLDEFVNNLRENDYVRIVTIGAEINTLCDYTRDVSVLREAIKGINNKAKKTYLYLGLSDVLESTLKTKDDMPERAALVLFTDGADDSDGSISKEEIMDMVSELHIPVYVIGVKGNDSAANLSEVGWIARQSGGALFSYNDMEIADAVQAVRSIVDNAYIVQALPEDSAYGLAQLDWSAHYAGDGYTVSSADYSYRLTMDGVVTPTPEPQPTPEPLTEIAGFAVTVNDNAVNGRVEFEEGEQLLAWGAESGVKHFQVLFEGPNVFYKDTAAAAGTYCVRESMLVPDEVYRLEVGALPVNGTEDDIIWKTLELVYRDIAPTPEPVGEIEDFVIQVNGRDVTGQKVEFEEGEQIIRWSAKGGVEGYQLKFVGENIYYTNSVSSAGTYEVDTGMMIADKVYRMEIGAMPKNGTEENIEWKMVELVRREPAPLPTPTPVPVSQIKGFTILVNNRESVGDTVEFEEGEQIIRWEAKSGVERYNIQFTGKNVYYNDTVAEPGVYEVDTAVLVADEVYRFEVGALPKNGTEEDVEWKTVELIRHDPVPTPAPTEVPVAEIEGFTLTLNGQDADGVPVEFEDGAYTIHWNAKAGVDRYRIEFNGKNIYYNNTVSESGSYEIDVSAMATDEVYCMKVGAQPLNGDENDIVWKTIELIRREPAPTESPTAMPVSAIKGFTVTVNGRETGGQPIEFESGNQLIRWNAESGVASYSIRFSGKNLYYEKTVSTSDTYEVDAALLAGNEVYCFEVGALPENGTEKDIVWRAVELMRYEPLPEPTSELPLEEASPEAQANEAQGILDILAEQKFKVVVVLLIVAAVIILILLLQKPKLKYKPQPVSDDTTEPDTDETLSDDTDDSTIGSVTCLDGKLAKSYVRIELTLDYDGKTNVIERIVQDKVTIGRRITNDVCINSLRVSREHGEIINRSNELYFRNLSQNGSAVNGMEVTEDILLKDDDTITMGNAWVNIHILNN